MIYGWYEYITSLHKMFMRSCFYTSSSIAIVLKMTCMAIMAAFFQLEPMLFWWTWKTENNEYYCNKSGMS